MNRGACQATVHGVTKNWTILEQFSTHAGRVSWNVGFLDLIVGKSKQNWDRLVILWPQMSWEGTIVDLKSIWIIFVHLVIFFLALPTSKHFECEVEQVPFTIPYMIYIGGFDRETLCNKHTHTHTHKRTHTHTHTNSLKATVPVHGSGPQPFAEYLSQELDKNSIHCWTKFNWAQDWITLKNLRVQKNLEELEISFPDILQSRKQQDFITQT